MIALYFLHIPKTGGMALDAVIRRAYPFYEYRRFLRADELPFAQLKHLKSHAYVNGHLGWLPDECLRPGTRRCTVLRDPIARTISHLRYWRHVYASKDGDPHQLTAILTPQFSAEEIAEEQAALLANDFLHVLRSPRFRLRFRNQQCLNLARTVSFDPAAASANANEHKPADEHDMALAEQRLREIDFVGLTERLDDSARIIGAAIGLQVKQVPKENVTPGSAKGGARSDAPAGLSVLSPDTAAQSEISEILTDINQYDIRLYQLAQRRFEEQLAQLHTHPPQIRATWRSRGIALTWDAYAMAKHAYHRLVSRRTRSKLRAMLRTARS